MPRLPQPSTTSPGFLQLLYVTGTVNHVIRQHLLAGIDPTDATLMESTASAWATVLAPCMSNVCVIQGWKVLDPTGVELYSGVFSTPFNGTLLIDPSFASQSSTFDIVGRGNPGGGLAQGNTRHMWFPGIFDPNRPEARWTIPGTGVFKALLDFLNGDNQIGADIYGSKAVFRQYLNLQVNAHYQKRYGY